jgi:hypothetical protein
MDFLLRNIPSFPDLVEVFLYRMTLAPNSSVQLKRYFSTANQQVFFNFNLCQFKKLVQRRDSWWKEEKVRLVHPLLETVDS